MQNTKVRRYDMILHEATRLAAHFQRWIKIGIRIRITRTADHTTQQHLARLSKTSPHLLEDIGFVRDVTMANQSTEIWTLANTKIVVSCPSDAKAKMTMRTGCAKAQGFRG